MPGPTPKCNDGEHDWRIHPFENLEEAEDGSPLKKIAICTRCNGKTMVLYSDPNESGMPTSSDVNSWPKLGSHWKES